MLFYECCVFSLIMETFWLFAWLFYKQVLQKISWTGIGQCILYLCLLNCKLGRSCTCICSTFLKVCGVLSKLQAYMVRSFERPLLCEAGGQWLGKCTSVVVTFFRTTSLTQHTSPTLNFAKLMAWWCSQKRNPSLGMCQVCLLAYR